MPARDTPPDRPTAAWINRYAAGLLSAAPSLRPLDAVRMAMDACDDAARPPLKPPEPARPLVRR
ncbi:MAG TPA: hypothetical protein VFQ20_01335 [Burkholderiaceae bacterium]|nr:hypothetical protein [Burkholderiaceae bacterium]